MLGTLPDGPVRLTRRAPRVSYVTVVVLLVVMTAIGACTSGRASGRAPDRAAGNGDVRTALTYAYRTEAEFVVVGDGHVAATIPVRDKQLSQPRWTMDGQHFAVLQRDRHTRAAADNRLIVVDARSGRSSNMPCPFCASQAPIGAAGMLELQQEPGVGGVPTAAVASYDLSGRTKNHDLTLSQQIGIDSQLVAGSLSDALLLDLSPSGFAFDRIRDDGRVIPAGAQPRPPNIQRGGYFLSIDAASGRSLPGDSGGEYAVALHATAESGDCATAGEVTMLTPGRKPERFDLEKFRPTRNPNRLPVAMRAESVRWAQDQSLHAIVTAGLCDGTDSYTTPPSEWRLSGSHWTAASSDGLAEEIPTSGGLLELRRNATSTSRGYDLVFEQSGKKTSIADSVLTLLPPPT
jgi:hypothetical protein